MTDQQRKWLKRRQAVEPAIGHLKHDNGMVPCGLLGATGDALHAVLCAAGYNIRWFKRSQRPWGQKTPGWTGRFGAAVEFCRADQLHPQCKNSWQPDAPID